MIDSPKVSLMIRRLNYFQEKHFKTGDSCAEFKKCIKLCDNQGIWELAQQDRFLLDKKMGKPFEFFLFGSFSEFTEFSNKKIL